MPNPQIKLTYLPVLSLWNSSLTNFVNRTYSNLCRWLKTYTVKFKHHFRQELSLCKKQGEILQHSTVATIDSPYVCFPFCAGRVRIYCSLELHLFVSLAIAAKSSFCVCYWWFPFSSSGIGVYLINTILVPTHEKYSSLVLKNGQGGDCENRSRLVI